MKLFVFIIFWVAGIVLALLGNKNLREWRDYCNPKTYLFFSVLLTLFISWAMVIILIIEDEFELPKKLYHSCRKHSRIHYVEEYLDEDGNPTDFKNCKVHHTYRVYTCRECGKEIEREQLQ